MNMQLTHCSKHTHTHTQSDEMYSGRFSRLKRDLRSAAPSFPPFASCRRSRISSCVLQGRSSEPLGPEGGGRNTSSPAHSQQQQHIYSVTANNVLTVSPYEDKWTPGNPTVFTFSTCSPFYLVIFPSDCFPLGFYHFLPLCVSPASVSLLPSPLPPVPPLEDADSHRHGYRISSAVSATAVAVVPINRTIDVTHPDQSWSHAGTDGAQRLHTSLMTHEVTD